MDQLGVDAVDEIRLAGAFGSQIDPTHAMILGLIPDCDLAHVRSAGNAAGTGALIALLSGAARTEIEGGRPARREDRDRGRAALPGALRGGDGVPAQDGAVPEPGRGRGPARARRRRWPTAATTVPQARATSADADGPSTRRQQGGRLMDETRAAPDPAVGRRARRLRLAAHAEHVPFLTRKLAPFEVLDEEGLVAHRAQRRHDPPGGRPRVPRRRRGRSGCFRDAGADVEGERVRFPRGMCRSIVQAHRAAPVHPVRAERGAQRRDRRDAHGLRARTTARRSCATWTAAGATARSRTSATS